jgi:hypothetical protein
MTALLPRVLLLAFAGLSLALPPAPAPAAPPAPVAQPRVAATNNRYLVADFDNNRVVEVDEGGAILFRYGEPATKTTVVEAPARAFRLANGNTMIVDNGEITADPRVYGRVLEVSPSGAIVNQVTGLYLPTDVQVLSNGKWLISEFSRYRRRVIEVAPGTAVTDSTPAIYSGGATGGSAVGVYSAVRLSNGNTVISDHGNNKVVEINSAGAVIRQRTGLASPTRVTVTADGTWLIPEKTAYRVIEYDPAIGQTIRTFTTGKNPSNPNRDKFFLSSAERLPNGNTLIADGENNRVIEMDNSGAIVRTLPSPSGDTGSGGGQTCPGASVSTYGCPRDATLVPDTTAPVISAFTLSPASTTSQRVTATVTATDPSGSGSQSGITTYEYSLDGGTTWVIGKSIAASASPGPQSFDVDLANPAAGGNWTGGSREVRVRVTDDQGTVSALATASVSFAPGTITTRYLAEGYTGGTFDEYLTLANPGGSTIYVSVTFQYAGASSGTPGMVVAVEGNQRRTVKIDDIAGAGKELSLKLQSNAAFYAERPMYFTNYPAAAGVAYNRRGISALSGINGGHLGVAAIQPIPTWYFAEGYTGDGFEGYFTIQNPNSGTATVTIRYYLAGGGYDDRTVTVGGNQRKTVAIHGADSQGGIGTGKEFSAKVSSDASTPIIVERVQYFRYTGSMGAVTGGTATLGATSPSTTWYFAEGYTGSGFDEYLTIQNPNATAGTATITYYIEGQSTPATCSVALVANSRTTVAVHADAPAEPCGLGRNKAHATKVQTTVATVVERPMYFLYNGASISSIDGGHNVMGATSLLTTGQSVVMAEGYTGAGFEQYLTFQNPNQTAATVRITYLKADGTAVTRPDLTLAANQRTTVAVHNASDPTGAGLGTGQEFSTKIEVIDGGASGVLAERVMYFRYLGSATGGTSAFGVSAT